MFYPIYITKTLFYRCFMHPIFSIAIAFYLFLYDVKINLLPPLRCSFWYCSGKQGILWKAFHPVHSVVGSSRHQIIKVGWQTEFKSCVVGNLTQKENKQSIQNGILTFGMVELFSSTYINTSNQMLNYGTLPHNDNNFDYRTLPVTDYLTIKLK